MDEALPKAEQYILRSGRERELKPVCYRLLSLVKRLSKQRLRRAELPAGLLSDLEPITHQLGNSTPQEASAYLNQLLSRMSPQTRQIIHWRVAGHSFRQIAKELRCDHATIIRAYNRELRELVRPSASRKLSEQDQDDG
jgi:DNA-directed RNA polymerase specialized sigma24 family protein